MSDPVEACAVPDPPDRLVCGEFVVRAGQILHRLHAPGRGGQEFNPGFGSSRFAPIKQPDGSKIPTLYAATSFECAVHEYIFRDIDPAASFKSVRSSSIEPLLYSTLEVAEDLTLVPLFSADLMAWGLDRTQLIDTPRSAYPHTRTWAERVFSSTPVSSGMIWTSRRYDQEKALVLFGLRVAPVALRVLSTVRIGSDERALGVIYNLARRSGILIAK